MSIDLTATQSLLPYTTCSCLSWIGCCSMSHCFEARQNLSEALTISSQISEFSQSRRTFALYTNPYNVNAVISTDAPYSVLVLCLHWYVQLVHILGWSCFRCVFFQGKPRTTTNSLAGCLAYFKPPMAYVLPFSVWTPCLCLL